jgi:threonine dehydratase
MMLEELRAARERIRPHVLRTPLTRSAALSERAGAEVWLKLECRQHTGCFKPRGAVNRIASLSEDERARGVVAASAGNHALGVAHACRAVGVEQADLFVQADAAPAKVRKLRGYPVRLHLLGANYEEAQQAALAHARETGAVFVSSYDDAAVIAGAGTCGLEIVEDLPEPDAVVVPVGGGALIAGIATAVKAARPRARVIGVNPEASPSALESLRAGRALDPYEHGPTRAHGLAGGFGRVPFEIARRLVDEVVLVSELELARGIAALIDAE